LADENPLAGEKLLADKRLSLAKSHNWKGNNYNGRIRKEP